MKQKLSTTQTQGHSTNMLLVAVTPDSNLSTDGTALDSVSGLRGSGIGAISKAIELLQPITYQSNDIGYFVVKNGRDMGGEDFCKKCITEAVSKARDYHRKSRQQLLRKYDKILADGFYYNRKKKIKVTKEEVLKSKRYELKQFPAKASFGYEGHDPDFGGGLSMPCTCGNCGENFTCNFEPDTDEANHLLSIVNHSEPLTDADKWEIDISLSNYEYMDDEVKIILEKVADIIIQKNGANV